MLALAEVNQAIWVLHGKGDAGAFNEGDWQALPEKVRARLRVFARSRPIERGLISFRASLEPATRARVEERDAGARPGRGGAAARSPTPPASRASSG